MNGICIIRFGDCDTLSEFFAAGPGGVYETAMKAIVYEKYGTPETVELKEVAKPAPTDGQVLVRVHAASVNSWDWDLLTGRPLAFRIWFGLLRPNRKILGGDIAGRVEAVGNKVTRFRSGDEVFGDISMSGWGGFAEYVCAPEEALALKSRKMTFAEAAAIPQAGLLALQGLRKKEIEPGDRVLINGGGGGVGTFAIQIAKSRGAEVTGVDHPAKLDVMRSLGADHVVDYTTEDFTRSGKQYDVILDVVAHRSIFDYARALCPTGVFVMVGGSVARILQVATFGPLISRAGTKKLGILMWHPDASDLEEMKKLYEAGKVVPVVDRRYPLGKTADALRYLGEGRVRGKVVVTVNQDGDTYY